MRADRHLSLLSRLMPGSLLVGTSGFSFKEWKGNFYPEDLPDKKMLEHYATKLSTVEINYTFRRMPSESTLTGWKERVPDGFRFTLKAPQRITHYKRLVDADEDAAEFVRLARGLGDKLGTILFQLPPNFVFDRSVLEGFANSLPPVVRYAMEFRHDSFKSDEVKEILDANGIALCGAETDEKDLAEVPVTAGHAYLRLRKTDYDDSSISSWAQRLTALLGEGRDVYCYFKHEEAGAGPRYALKLMELAGAAAPSASAAAPSAGATAS